MKNLFKKRIPALILLLTTIFLGSCSSGVKETVQPEKVYATVIEIEKYGHAVLDITTNNFISEGYDLGDVVHVKVDSYESDMPFFDGYYTNPGDVLLRGLAPEKNIAVCINYGDFSEETGISLGDTVEITMSEKAAMLAYQNLCSLKYTDNREDYADDVTFANFRNVTSGNIGEGKLYRTASPINNEHNRASYANALIAEANVATIVNLADSAEDIEEYIKAEDFNSDYYLNLYRNGKVMALDLAGDFFSEDFAKSITEGIIFLAKNQPPYALHCTEGKDRAGFAVMLLSALMGAELDEIIDDYMISFHNYFGINKETDPEKYDAVLNNNLIPILCHVMDVPSSEMLTQINLESAVIKFLLDSGMKESDIITLKEKLS